MKSKNNKIIIILLGLITFLGIIWLSKTNKKIEGMDTPKITPESSRQLVRKIKRDMKKAGVPAPKMGDIEKLFADIMSIITGQVDAAKKKQEELEQAEENKPVVNTISPKFIDKTFFKGNKFADAFCAINGMNPVELNNQCSTLTAENCNATNCCIWQNGKKCVAGDAKGPTYINGVSSDADYYSYKYKCYGKCGNNSRTDGNSIYNEDAKSCYTSRCSIEAQRCLSGTPGSRNTDWTCIDGKWSPDDATACEGSACSIEEQRCLKGTPGAINTDWTCVNKKWKPDDATSCYSFECPVETQRCLKGTPGAGDTDWTCKDKKWTPDATAISKFSNMFSGKDKCLDIVNDGQNNKLIMSPCGNFSGQQWSKINNKSHYTFKNNFSGSEKCLDIVNDGQKNKLIMSPCGISTGQQWNQSRNGSYYSFKNNLSGNDKCLDIVNDGQNNQLIMSPCGNYSGQQWVSK